MAALAGLVAPAPAAAQRPNIVVVMTDDMRTDELEPMENVNKLLVAGGASFTRHYASYPLCCPARVTLLTGQYAHNHDVFGNRREDTERFMARRRSNILPEWLRDAGYRTAMVGKYLNEYGHEPRDLRTQPVGFDEWHALLDPAGERHPTYYRYQLNDNGEPHSYGSRRRDHLTGVLTGKAVRFIRRSKGRKPFFLWTSYFAPHNGGPRRDPHNAPHGYCDKAPKPAPGDLQGFSAAAPLTTASLNEVSIQYKRPGPALAQPMAKDVTSSGDRLRNCRRASLRAVDRGVARIVDALGAERSNTLIVFVSDNGFMLGEHGIARGKPFLYEESSQVPLVLSWPGVVQPGAVDDLVVNADIAPTILAAATRGAGRAPQSGRVPDGISLLDLLAGKAPARNAIVLESRKFWGIVTEPFTLPGLVVTERYKWARNKETESFELYNLDRDSDESDNLYATPMDSSTATIADVLRRWARKLRRCRGTERRQGAKGPLCTAGPPAPRQRLPGRPPPSGDPVAPVQAPGVGGEEPSALTCNSARLNGWVNPHGSPTSFYFEYWKRGVNVAHQTGSGDAGAGEGRVGVSRLAENLQADTGYAAKLIASNAAGRSVSEVFSFTTRERC